MTLILRWMMIKQVKTKSTFQYIKLTKALLIVCFGFFSHLNLFSQTEQITDSLIRLSEQKSISDSLRLEVLEEIAKNQTLNPELRLQYTRKIHEIASQKEDTFWLYKASLRFGHTFKKTGDLDKALENYFNAVNYAQILKNERREAIAYSGLGTVYKIIENYSKSLYFFNKGIALLRKVNDVKGLAGSLTNTGELYKINRDYDSAFLYFKEARHIYDSLDFSLGIAYNTGNIGLLYAELNQPEKARENMEQAISILTELEDYYPIAFYELSLADIYAKKGDIELSLNYCLHSLKIALDHRLKEQIRDANLKLSELYANQNKFQKAYYHQNQYLIYRDSINNEATIRKMAELQTEYEVSQKQLEVNLLEKQQKQQNIIFIALIIIILLMAFLVFLYYRNFKRKQTLNLIITKRKEEVEAQRDQLVAMNETKEKFLSVVSHDLLGPVNSFKGLSTIMKASIESNNTEDLLYIHKLFDNSVNNLSSLLSNLLDWSVTQKGAIPYIPERIVLFNLVNELLDLFSNMAKTKDINLKSTVDNEAIIWADINSVKTILRNLVSNAIKFTNANGEITISAAQNNEVLAIHVTDTGIGMPQEKIDNLLASDNYNRSAGTKGEGGIGLGLQLVKEFVEMNKGIIAIESKESVGTTITVFLPINEQNLL